MIEVRLYGKLRRFTDNQDPTRDSIIYIPVETGDTIEDIIRRIGIPPEEVGSTIFLNGRYVVLNRKVKDGDRLAIFPDNMAMVIV
ncbi:MAG: MoaD/ThiS family protein [Dehalococcoidales bacterium]|jgi:molybdopterin converting factor small subunit|nr:MoaD/ThiS family protein [Dehalococcoidales bacterium]MDP7285605.1 MoaD/ThiS family protein [Dehalococcoidales bacterium]